MCEETIDIYGRSDRAVRVSSSNEVVLSADDQGAAAFDMVGCLASDTVSAALRPTCVSLIDANRPDWYVRHSNYFLYVAPRNSSDNLTLFEADASFIVHKDTVFPGSYALESLNYCQHYMSSQADGRLKIVPRDEIVDQHDVSFTVSHSTTRSTYSRFGLSTTTSTYSRFGRIFYPSPILRLLDDCRKNMCIGVARGMYSGCS